MARPHPIPREMICSECGLDWDDHPRNPTKSDCIELLKAELDRRPRCQGYHHHWHCGWGHCNCYINHWTTYTWYGSSAQTQPVISYNTGSTISDYQISYTNASAN